MNKLDMESIDIVKDNIDKIGELFPNVIVESEKGKTIDFDLLKQELSNEIVEGNKEKYQLTWPGKKEAILNANTPTKKTLRPVIEKSVDFDNTQNIYIEGDNLEALKILQESYLGKIKCIYIDPPYNTGNDFIYNDNFNKHKDTELEESGQIDEEGNKLITNSSTNGRFHSDWLSMMYPRLKLARNLLQKNGVLFISIDDNELYNMKKICDEIFGEKNYIETFSWIKTETPANLAKMTKKAVEYVLCYSKSSNVEKFVGLKKESKSSNGLMNQTNSEKDLIFPADVVDTSISNGIIKAGEYGTSNYKIILLEDVEVKDGIFITPIKLRGRFKWTQEKLNEEIRKGTKISIKTSVLSPSYEKEDYDPEAPWNIINGKFGVGTNESASTELRKIFNEKTFDFPKPVSLIKYLISFLTKENDIVLDFFSGSATTAEAVMRLNSEDNCKRKFILIQLPEISDSKSAAFKLGFETICEIGEERIRRASKKIKEETKANIDYGFRVYKVDSSSMKDIYYKPNEIKQTNLFDMMSNVKEDRTTDDLLTQVILDLGLTLDLKIEEKSVLDNKVYYVADNSLVACFDENVNIDIVNEICKCKPLKVVFKDSSFKNDKDKINLEERIKKLSPETEINVL